jgi:Protein of unknown function (DUF3788)
MLTHFTGHNHANSGMPRLPVNKHREVVYSLRLHSDCDRPTTFKLCVCRASFKAAYSPPQEKFFKASLVFGQKATTEILQSKISENIKEELRNAKVYAEGRGLRIDVKNKSIFTDLKELIKIKISYRNARHACS